MNLVSTWTTGRAWTVSPSISTTGIRGALISENSMRWTQRGLLVLRWMATMPVSVSVTISVSVSIAVVATITATITIITIWTVVITVRRSRCARRSHVWVSRCWCRGSHGRCSISILPLLLECLQHLSKFVVTKMHLMERNWSYGNLQWSNWVSLTLPPKWSAKRRSESKTDRYAPHTSQTRSFWWPDAPDVSESCCNSLWVTEIQR